MWVVRSLLVCLSYKGTFPCYSIILVRLRNTPDSRSLARERDDTHLKWDSESTGLIEFEYSDARGHRVSKPL
jgi:hypothetical protein